MTNIVQIIETDHDNGTVTITAITEEGFSASCTSEDDSISSYESARDRAIQNALLKSTYYTYLPNNENGANR